ncbi:hypothetical protein Msil_2790 [Methylocella silvestris BL2]|uniref:Uncharacterized protein n=1 Tax=Methylocella silvestris (strain DSM 15510 / CIP 108128 / LMG 27833 / NCIMB 13906 / BL2) TaxID=395965 RepID=B8ES11_METSB|nr:hypothetical protein [Methylocella silvestris]ACK51709.1 hypothetical protein Msil_2790 [Methylocella silvestris BL2]
MPNSTVPAAATGLPSQTRRLFLRSGSAAAVFGAVTAAAAASVAPEVSPELDHLIAVHRHAHAAFLAARERHIEAERVCATAPKCLPFTWDGKTPIRLSSDQEEGLIHAAQTIIGLGSAGLSSPAVLALSEKRRKQITAAIKGARKDITKVVRDAFAKVEEIRRSSGIEEAERDLVWARDGEQNALKALCGFKCATLAEVNHRADYLVTVGPENITADAIVAMLPTNYKREA